MQPLVTLMSEIDEIKKLIRDTKKELELGANPYWFGTRLNIYRKMLEYAESQES